MKRLKETLAKIERADYDFAKKVQKRLDGLTKPQGSLGRLEEMAKQIAQIKMDEAPSLDKKVIFTMAGDHGVADEGVSAYPKEVTAQMVYNFLRGGAGINVLARHVGARVIVVDMGVAKKIEAPDKCLGNFIDKKVDYGTKSFTKGPAMQKDAAVRSLEYGIEVLESILPEGIDIMGTGDMGIGNTTPSSAITAVITGRDVEDVTGRGTGVDDETFARKQEVIKRGIEVNKPDAQDAIDVLSKVGGFEIGGLAGLTLCAASNRIPVVIDGFIAAAAALTAYTLEPKVKDYLIASHSSVERGHKAILDYIGLKPIFDLRLRLGEGTGAALGIGIAEASAKILTQMATFREASVSQKI